MPGVEAACLHPSEQGAGSGLRAGASPGPFPASAGAGLSRDQSRRSNKSLIIFTGREGTRWNSPKPQS